MSVCAMLCVLVVEKSFVEIFLYVSPSKIKVG